MVVEKNSTSKGGSGNTSRPCKKREKLFWCRLTGIKGIIDTGPFGGAPPFGVGGGLSPLFLEVESKEIKNNLGGRTDTDKEGVCLFGWSVKKEREMYGKP